MESGSSCVNQIFFAPQSICGKTCPATGVDNDYAPFDDPTCEIVPGEWRISSVSNSQGVGVVLVATTDVSVPTGPRRPAHSLLTPSSSFSSSSSSALLLSCRMVVRCKLFPMPT